ncbi:MAG: MMPL family transporter [Bacteroidia bacterium]|nr:MMPL family transporter [Bacteroidia bacterium]
MNILLRYRKFCIGLIILLTIGFFFGVGKLTINFSFESFYPKEDPEFQYYEVFQEMFSEEQNYAVYIALQSPAKDIFDSTFLAFSDSIFRKMGSLPNVDSMVSATTFEQIRRMGLGIRRRPYLDFSSQEAVTQSRQRLEKDSTLVGNLITRDLRYVCAYIFIDPLLFDTKERDVLVDEIDEILEASGTEYIISGIPYIRTGYVKKLQSELVIFVTLATLFIFTILFFTYRHLWGIIIPFVIINVSLIWTLGLMGFAGQSINLISEMLIPILFVVGMSDIIHLATKYLQEIKLGKSRVEAMQTTLKEIGLAVFLTSLTTAIGFASLMVSNVPPIRDFGLYASLGVMITWFITIAVMPAALLWIRPESLMKAQAIDNHVLWDRLLQFIYRLISHRQRLIVRLSWVTVLVSLLLILRIPMTTFLIEDIGKNDPIRKAMIFFEKELYGLRPFEIGIHAKEGYKITDREILVEMEKIQDFLNQKGYFSPFFSPATYVQQANYFYHNNSPRYNRVPDTQQEIDELLTFTFLNGGGELFSRVVGRDTTVARISARVPDAGSDVFNKLYAELDSFVVNHCNHQIFTYRLTGHAYLTEHNLKYLRQSLMGGLGIAFVVIGAIMGLMFRSWKMLIISIVPNVIPLVLTGGVMGLFGIPLTTSTALVFVIAFGIAVDDTIHFLTRYRIEILQGHNVETAIRNTLLGTGKAMILTSAVLLGGFLILLTSNFGGTFNTGLFTGLTILFALIGDIIILPILLRMFGGKHL